jgi:signal transduction histidine kinase
MTSLPTNWWRRERASSFFWQGILILGPAILLAAFGLYSLRQDRVLAEHEAREQAGRLAVEWAEVLIPELFISTALPSSAIEHFRANPSGWEYEPAQRQYAEKGQIVCLIDEGFEIDYPPPWGGWPTLEPLDLAVLPEEMAELWIDARQEAFSGDLETALTLLGEFLAQHPPPEFAGPALLQSALLAKSIGNFRQARDFLEVLIAEFPDAKGETGLPLRPLALIEMIPLVPENDRPRSAELLNALGATVVLQPGPFSSLLIERAAKNSPGEVSQIARHWKEILELHQRTRDLFGSWLANLPDNSEDELPPLVWFHQANALWLASFDPDRHKVIFWPEAKVLEAVEQLLDQQFLPAHFAISAVVAGRNFGPVPDPETLLAGMNGWLRSPGPDASREADFMTAVFLLEPAEFYARQRSRTLLFGGLIGFSSMALAIGFVAARRAFLRQQRVSEMKSNFVSSVSHEMRAPIASIRLMAEELNATAGLDRKKSKDYNRFIVQECRRLSGLIENVLDFSRQDQGRKQYVFEPADLVGLMEETVRLLELSAGEQHQEITVEIAETARELEPVLDARALQQVLINLLDNALKHSPPGKAVRLGVEFPLARETAEAVSGINRALEAHSSLAIWVEDEGEGIPPGEQQKIFEKFYRRGSELRRETPGIGLGLAIVKYIIDAHNGLILLRSAPGKGSRFTVVLPLDGPGQPRAA